MTELNKEEIIKNIIGATYKKCNANKIENKILVCQNQIARICICDEYEVASIMDQLIKLGYIEKHYSPFKYLDLIEVKSKLINEVQNNYNEYSSRVKESIKSYRYDANFTKSTEKLIFLHGDKNINSQVFYAISDSIFKQLDLITNSDFLITDTYRYDKRDGKIKEILFKNGIAGVLNYLRNEVNNIDKTSNNSFDIERKKIFNELERTKNKCKNIIRANKKIKQYITNYGLYKLYQLVGYDTKKFEDRLRRICYIDSENIDFSDWTDKLKGFISKKIEYNTPFEIEQ